MAYTVLCIDDDAEFLLNLKIQVKKVHPVFTAQTLGEGMAIIERESIELVLLDVKLGAENGLDGIEQIKRRFPRTDVVMVSGQRDPKLIVTAIRSGASDYLCKPFARDELLAVIEKTQTLNNLRARNDALVKEARANEMSRPLIGESKPFKKLLQQVRCVRGYGANVLIEGESGTGKELIARYIHELEGDPARPFIAVNCAAIPDTLIESELFGHEKGAFSGAFQRKIGKFELAHGGDIFLDEINSLKPDLQVKILRVLQEKELYRVGGNTPVKITFRVIAAANATLDDLVAGGGFRVDLLHRLRVVSFRIPALRERPEDIPVLVKHFLKKFSGDGKAKQITPDTMERLLRHDWQGNARELEHLIENMIIMTPGDTITPVNLPDWFKQRSLRSADGAISVAAVGPAGEIVPLRDFVTRLEKDYIVKILDRHRGDKTKTARLLGISRTCLYDKIGENVAGQLMN